MRGGGRGRRSIKGMKRTSHYSCVFLGLGLCVHVHWRRALLARGPRTRPEVWGLQGRWDLGSSGVRTLSAPPGAAVLLPEATACVGSASILGINESRGVWGRVFAETEEGVGGHAEGRGCAESSALPVASLHSFALNSWSRYLPASPYVFSHLPFSTPSPTALSLLPGGSEFRSWICSLPDSSLSSSTSSSRCFLFW